jgi:hypothetical protein
MYDIRREMCDIRRDMCDIRLAFSGQHRLGRLPVRLQHTPVIRIVVRRIHVHNEITMFAEFTPLHNIG